MSDKNGLCKAETFLPGMAAKDPETGMRWRMIDDGRWSSPRAQIPLRFPMNARLPMLATTVALHESLRRAISSGMDLSDAATSAVFGAGCCHSENCTRRIAAEAERDAFAKTADFAALRCREVEADRDALRAEIERVNGYNDGICELLDTARNVIADARANGDYARAELAQESATAKQLAAVIAAANAALDAAGVQQIECDRMFVAQRIGDVVRERDALRAKNKNLNSAVDAVEREASSWLCDTGCSKTEHIIVRSIRGSMRDALAADSEPKP